MLPELTKEVLFQEVSLRDGLQNEPRVLAPEVRAQLVDLLADAGLVRIQIGSFVNPKLVPQMGGTDRLWQCVTKRPGVRYSALVLNERGLEAAAGVDVPHVEVYASASETHSRKNVNMSVADAVRAVSAMIRRAISFGMGVTAGVMCAFGCAYEGAVPVDRVLRIVDAFLAENPTEIALADTTGMGEPQGVRQLVSLMKDRVDASRIGLHLHDTRGLGLANLHEGLQLGVRRFDTSVGGLGGCPFIPGAPGNLATERAIEAVEASGFNTGIDVARLGLVRRRLAELLGNKTM
ncbi:MAG: hydroxymethylglutaryl-CoA lyase [Desulfomonile sp.]|nr:hydroxymethylglutaryl-CoA lyase [Desulfomonile sp.]